MKINYDEFKSVLRKSIKAFDGYVYEFNGCTLSEFVNVIIDELTNYEQCEGDTNIFTFLDYIVDMLIEGEICVDGEPLDFEYEEAIHVASRLLQIYDSSFN